MRARVVAGYVLLLVLALGVAMVVIRQVLLARVDREIELALVQEVDELRLLAAGNDPRTSQPFGTDTAALFDTFLARNVPDASEAFYTVVSGRPHRTSPGAPIGLFDAPELLAEFAALEVPRRIDLETEVGAARLLAVPLLADGSPQATFVVTFFPAEDLDQVSQAVRTVLVVGAVVLVLSSLLAWSLAGRVLRPVGELTRTARRIGETDLGARIPVEGDDELAQLGETFNDMLDRLEAAFAGQRRFLDDVAHELRTPITIVAGHLELLDEDPEERAEQIELVTDELQRMGRYVKDLLVVAKAGQPDFLRLELVDVGELVEGLAARTSALATRRWEVDEAPAPGHVVTLADPDRLTQAVANLAQNAVEHTTEDDVVALGASCADGVVRIWVRDTGPGVDASVREHLFSRFARGDRSEAHRPEGTGLGLAIVDAVARAHRGRATLEDEGPGATFSIAFPVLLDTDHADEDDDLPAVDPGPTREVAP
ncbi:MAG: HAMP domain-containing protein [Acidimicrobiia bacterium]|nr:HAMP domain-containing protein [Acidimicrobiia bacterium]